MMDSARYEQVTNSFHKVLSLKAAERSEFLRELQERDAELHREVLELLECDDAETDTFEVSRDGSGHRAFMDRVAGRTETEDLVGSRIGPYELLSELGSGGMATVYLCQQREPVERRVALKLIRRGMDSEKLLWRFALEKQALQLMEHPGIARLLDAGATEDGRPYFVLEVVDGQPINTYCDEHSLGVRERLRVLVAALRAVHHAHLRGVLHRDLKPSNLLVTCIDGRLQPKVIDFGLARAIDHDEGGSLATRAGEVLGTPAYMSPEQIAGKIEAIDVRTDVYAMGVVLFELLTGRLPHSNTSDASGISLLLQRANSTQATPTPSTQVRSPDEGSEDRAHLRGCDSRKLLRLLKGELDWITMRALEAEPERRYASLAEFADDLDAYLQNRPVLAGPPDLVYRVRKFVRRQRLALGAATLVLASLIGGITLALASARDARAAEREMSAILSDSEAQNDVLFRMLTRPDPRFGGKETTVIDVMEFGAEYALETYPDRPLVLTNVLGAIGGNYRELGMYVEAERLLRLALEYQTEGDPDNIGSLGFKANGLGLVLKRLRRSNEAEEQFRRAIELAKRDPGLREQSLGVWQYNLGRILNLHGRKVEAIALYEDALAWHLEYAPERMTGLGLVRLSLAGMLDGERPAAETEASFREALENLRQANPPVQIILVFAELQFGSWLCQQGREDEGLPIMETSLGTARGVMLDGDPRLIQFMIALTEVYLGADRVEESEELSYAILDFCQEHFDPETTDYCIGMSVHARWLAAAGEPEQAQEVLREVLPTLERLLPPEDSARSLAAELLRELEAG